MQELKIRYVWKDKSNGVIWARTYFMEYFEAGNGIEALKQFHELLSRDLYTGLSDPEGTEIFDGDTLKADENLSYKFNESGTVEYNSDYGSFIVRGKWSKNQHHEILTCDVAATCKVIGNKHTQKELVKN